VTDSLDWFTLSHPLHTRPRNEPLESSAKPAGAVRRRILVLFAHPALQKSRVNRVLAHGIDRMEGITFHDLYEAYPDLGIDVAAEQELLLAHDVIVFHHPFFWYSTPAILKEWQDLVLEHGWAYGREGTALRNKIMLNAVTTGGGEAAYEPGGHNGHTVREFLAPIEQTARLCGMTYLAPFVAHGTHSMAAERISGHAQEYRRLLVALRDDQLDVEAAADPHLPFMNRDLDRLLRGAP
jgi:glutathione-regulated potassium-efflux system ancillary protein KefG